MFALNTSKFKMFVLLVVSGASLLWITEGSAQDPSQQLNSELPPVELKSGANLDVDANEANEKQLPILMFFSMKHCPFCIEVEEDYLKPMLRNAEYDKKIIIRKVRIDGTASVRDFTGKERDAAEFSEDYNVSMVPTVVLVDSRGNRLSPSIVGIANSHYYSAELDNAIEASTQKIRSIAKR